MIGPKPLRIRFNKIDGIIRIYDGPRYLTLFGNKKYHAILYVIVNANSIVQYVI